MEKKSRLIINPIPAISASEEQIETNEVVEDQALAEEQGDLDIDLQTETEELSEENSEQMIPG